MAKRKIGGKQFESDKNWSFGNKKEAKKQADKLRKTERPSGKKIQARVIPSKKGEYRVFMRFK